MKPGIKAGQKYTDEYGIEYTVFSVRTQQEGYNTHKLVTAYTFDLSENRSNGDLNGKKCHWMYTKLY